MADKSFDTKYKIDHSFSKDGIKYSLAKTENQANEILDIFMGDFSKDDPLSKLLVKYGPKERPEPILKQVHELVAEGVSLIAIDEATGEIVGMRIGKIVNRAETLAEKNPTLKELMDVFPEGHARMMYLFTKYLPPDKVFLEHPDDQRIYLMFGLGVKATHRKRGIASELARQSLEVHLGELLPPIDSYNARLTFFRSFARLDVTASLGWLLVPFQGGFLTRY